MIEIIAGRKGKGKTKHLLDKANAMVKSAAGTLCYLDKSSKHMYELSNKIRLINVNEYSFAIENSDGFLGFLCGIISQDHDLEIMYLDSFLRLAYLEGEDISAFIDKLGKISDKYSVTFVLSVSQDADTLPETVKPHVILAL
ncbi:MAG: twitching motility protein PilT [Lachnospiraceae bacterium]|jgi:hypothetical protein|nr:twitching motility protein PilT [Lachnospiraceae bacterium]